MPYDVRIERPPTGALLDIRADPAAREAAQAAGFELPGLPNQVTGGSRRILWLGPDHWLVRAATEDEAVLEEAIGRALAGCHAAVTVVSDHYARFVVEGPDSRDVLAQGCGLDLDPQRFAPGRCARCRLARIVAVIEPRAPMPRYDILVESVLGDWFATWLQRAAGR